MDENMNEKARLRAIQNDQNIGWEHSDRLFKLLMELLNDDRVKMVVRLDYREKLTNLLQTTKEVLK